MEIRTVAVRNLFLQVVAVGLAVLCAGQGLSSAAVIIGPPQAVNSSDALKNGSLESGSGDVPDGWLLHAPAECSGKVFQFETEKPFRGERALRIDSTGAADSSLTFANCLPLEAAGWRGKRVRFRAAVRTADLAGNARAQLWMRVDRKTASESARAASGFFDNMDDRPIRKSDWAHHEIVGDVDADAEQIMVGLFVVGAGKVWLDDVSLEEVPSNKATTGSRGVGGELDFEPQPFWTWWLVMAAIGIGLLIVGQLSESSAGRFAFRFSLCYWLLYFFPAPVSSLVPNYGAMAESAYQNRVVDPAVRWTASNLLGIGKALAPPGGSGDSTFSHVQLLMTFVLAFLLAAIWSLVLRCMAEAPVLKDLLRSYVRYVLAFIMLSYGLAKLVSEGGQFRPPGVDQLEKTWGDSSPMNVLWTFMGLSWHYTFFGGLGEVLGGTLLLWRRTTVLGALVTFGVMLNVVMLNFCYDVPVKLYSFHLCFAAVFVLLPDAGRLANLLIWNRPVEAAELRPVWSKGAARVLHLVGKTWLIALGCGLPVLMTGWAEIQRATGGVVKPPLEGEFRVTEFLNTSEQEEGGKPAVAWRSFYLVTLPASEPGADRAAFCVVRLVDHDRLNAQATLSLDNRKLLLKDFTGSPLGELEVLEESPDLFVLTGTAFGKSVRVRLERSKLDGYLLIRRGFRWISEQPFNR